MRNDHHRSNTRLPRPVHRGDARYGAWGLAVLATFTATAALSGCVSDPDCGVCDPESLVLESIAGTNYAGKVVKLLGPQCEGDACPGELTSGQYFVDKIIPCLETDEAQTAARGAEEWCKVSPLIVTDGLQFIFNNLLDPTSIELVRRSPVNPQLFEVYDWKTRVVHLEGPIARYNGDYRRGASQTQPDRVTRLVSLSCIDNLKAQGQNFTHEELDAGVCDGTFTDGGKVWPLKTLLDQEVKTYGGETDTRRVSQSCTTPQNGPDTCCDACDYELSVNISKYGVTKPLGELEQASQAQRRSPNAGTGAPAIECNPMGDKFKECRDFIPHVYRGDEVRRFSYDWNGDGKIDENSETFRVPMADKLRETHPDDRPKGYEQRTVPCTTAESCASDSGPGLPGMDCVGTDANGQACTTGEDCEDKRCVAQWFVECRADKDTTGEGGFCVDRRWSGQGVAACFTTTESYKACGSGESCEPFAGTAQAGRRFAYGDADLDGFISSAEGCRGSLGSEDFAACDPYFQSAVVPVDLYDRKETLPSTTRRCVCTDDPAEGCQGLVDRLCREDGDPNKPILADREGEYALKFVSKNGGVVYDPAVKGVLFLPADLGSIPRSFAETCSAGRARGAGSLNVKDGWRANDSGFFETYENFDRAMCSSSEYKVVFETEEGGGLVQYIRDKVGNTLYGKSTYVLRTPDFHIVPGSGFPTDNLRIGACDDFEIRFSNKYDMSPVNVNKVQIVEIAEKGGDQELGVVAGGPGCAATKEEYDADQSKPPCLTINVRDQEIGSIRVEIDAKAFGAVLTPGKIYRMKVPGITLAENETVFDAMKDPARYNAAFWDACGMPLVLSMPKVGDKGLLDDGGKAQGADYLYDFEIDAPKCKEDQDLDSYQFSCDNAPDVYNPDQNDSDSDGFGDLIDLCVTIADDVNTADSDKDGIGNDCDLCTRQPQNYNANAKDAMAPAYMLVRNIPDQADFDGDGIGDVCDNCIVRSNCSDFGNDAPEKDPYKIGDPIPVTNDNICQTDNDATPFIGDACIEDGAPIQLAEAAGPVGIGPNDDFDQDGLANMADKCPRQRVAACETDAECGGEIVCGANGLCENHLDSDGDGIGDECDTCAYAPNPKQIQDGQMQEDDPDGDFVGNPCETNSECYDRADPRSVAFYTKVAPSGMCCTTVFKDDVIDAPRLAANGEPLTRDEIEELMTKWREELAAYNEQQAMNPDDSDPPPAPLFVPLRKDCGDLGPDKCRSLTEKVATAPGVVELPAGCAEAGEPLSLDSPSIAGDANKLYEFMCTLPQLDQDFDGIGDKCDLCKFAFDPENTLYKDENNKVWPNYGEFCRGPWDPEAAPRLFTACGDVSEEGGGDTETGGMTTGPGMTTGGTGG